MSMNKVLLKKILKYINKNFFNYKFVIEKRIKKINEINNRVIYYLLIRQSQVKSFDQFYYLVFLKHKYP